MSRLSQSHADLPFVERGVIEEGILRDREKISERQEKIAIVISSVAKKGLRLLRDKVR